MSRCACLFNCIIDKHQIFSFVDLPCSFQWPYAGCLYLFGIGFNKSFACFWYPGVLAMHLADVPLDNLCEFLVLGISLNSGSTDIMSSFVQAIGCIRFVADTGYCEL